MCSDPEQTLDVKGKVRIPLKKHWEEHFSFPCGPNPYLISKKLKGV